MLRSASRALLPLALIALPLTRVAGQTAPRPTLEANADTNDWRSYYRRGVAQMARTPSRAEPYFRRAAELAPGRGEPLFALWTTFWLQNTRLLERALRGEPELFERPEVVAADSLRARAMARNPFVDQSLQVHIAQALGADASLAVDDEERAWVKYAAGDYRTAALLFGDAARRDRRRPVLHYYHAVALVAAGAPDSASAALERLLVYEREARAKAQRLRPYESQELFEYALGMLRATLGDSAGARAAFQRALEDNLAFAPAHEGLGRLALTAGDSAAAVRELALAVELAPSDPVYRQQLGAALYVARRPADAIVQFRTATRLAPAFADAWFGLAASEEVQGNREAAIAAYRQVLATAARESPFHGRAADRVGALERLP